MQRFLVTVCLLFAIGINAEGAGFDNDVRPLLLKYCSDCHSGKDANGEVDFDLIGASNESIETAFEIWESVAQHLQSQTMPPDDSPQPSDQERKRALMWYQSFVDTIQARPAELRPRRLSVIEYRNTLRTVLGFDLETAVIEAEQTDSERSLVFKLLPIDPPGNSGFTNDTHANPLTLVAWDQYAYLVDVALEELFSSSRRRELEVYTGAIDERVGITELNARLMMERFFVKAFRREGNKETTEKVIARIEGRGERDLTKTLKFELKGVLMSPQFLYRGLLAGAKPNDALTGSDNAPLTDYPPVDDFEFAERLSYFLWADMPDQELLALAEGDRLSKPDVLSRQMSRMLRSEKAKSLADVFASQWFTLSEIDLVSDNPPVRDALKSQPIDFMHYLFTNDRPLIEMVDSRIAFINSHTSRMYGADAKQMEKHVRRKGIETEAMPNQMINLETAAERGGLLTMPGILAMNRGPILRGTWMLERILGEHLPDPPANIGQVPTNKRGESLSFRERFEQHRSNQTCAVCHDKIDPLGFALQTFDDNGAFILASNYQVKRRGKKKQQKPEDAGQLDTSGRLPSGERFQDAAELKKILATSQRGAVIRNIVKRTMAYALCRKLELFDRPTVDTITQRMIDTNGTWSDLFHAIATSLPFRKTVSPERN